MDFWDVWDRGVVDSETCGLDAGVDLVGRCRGCAPPPPPPRDEAFFVFACKICLPHRLVTSFPRGAPLLRNHLDPPLRWLHKRGCQQYLTGPKVASQRPLVRPDTSACLLYRDSSEYRMGSMQRMVYFVGSHG